VGHIGVLRTGQRSHPVHVFRLAGLQRRVLGHQPVRAGHSEDSPGTGHQVLRADHVHQPHRDAHAAARHRQRGGGLEGGTYGRHVHHPHHHHRRHCERRRRRFAARRTDEAGAERLGVEAIELSCPTTVFFFFFCFGYFFFGRL